MAFLSFSTASSSLLAYAIVRDSDGLRWRFAGAGSPGFVAYASGSASDFAATMPQAGESLSRFVVASAPTGFAAGVTVGTLCIIYIYTRAGANITHAEMQAAPVGAIEAVWNGTEFVPASPHLLATVLADTDNIQTRLPAALVGGRMDSSVGAMAAGTITAGAIATGAIDADSLASDAVAEIVDQIEREGGMLELLTVGGSEIFLGRSPYKLSLIDFGPDESISGFVGDKLRLRCQLRDADGLGIPATGTLTATLTDLAGGSAGTPTVEVLSDELGQILVKATLPDTPGHCRLVVRRDVSSEDDARFGPILIEVNRP
jgi:hypothetical protein